MINSHTYPNDIPINERYITHFFIDGVSLQKHFSKPKLTPEVHLLKQYQVQTKQIPIRQ